MCPSYLSINRIDRDGDGADTPAFALEIGQHPPSLSLLNGLDVELGQLIPPQGTAHQSRQDHVIAFALQSGAVGTASSSFACSRVSQFPSRVPFCDVGYFCPTPRKGLIGIIADLVFYFGHGASPEVFVLIAGSEASMSTSDDAVVKSKLPMRWTLRQATGEMPWRIF
jgi:hypothetical protein